MQNHFELFHLPQDFGIDLSELERIYHTIQKQIHPDRFAQSTDTEKRVAMQCATRTNEAYYILKDPVNRAAYLCELNGIDLQTESNTTMPPAFLMQQMEWREQLDEAKIHQNTDAIIKLDNTVHATRVDIMNRLEALLDAHHFIDAAQLVRQLKFLERFAIEVDHVKNLIPDSQL